MNRSRTWRLWAVVTAVAAVAAACGSSGGAVTAPNTPKQIAADKKLATQAVLRASDMPTGFKGSPQDNSSNDKIPDAAARKFGSCVHLPEATITEMMNDTQQPGKPSVDAPEFEKGSGLTDVTIDNGVEIDRSSKDLSDPLDKFGATSAIPCWKDLFQAAFDNSKPANATFSGLAMSVLPLAHRRPASGLRGEGDCRQRGAVDSGVSRLVLRTTRPGRRHVDGDWHRKTRVALVGEVAAPNRRRPAEGGGLGAAEEVFAVAFGEAGAELGDVVGVEPPVGELAIGPPPHLVVALPALTLQHALEHLLGGRRRQAVRDAHEPRHPLG